MRRQPVVIVTLPYKGAIAISPDERLIANASSDEHGHVTLRDLKSGKEVRERILGHRISTMAFSPDSHNLSIGWYDRNREFGIKRIGISLYGSDGQCRDLESVERDNLIDRPVQVRFSPDGKKLWMASTDNLRVWSVASGKLMWHWRDTDFGRDSSLPFISAISKDCRLYFRSDSDAYTVWDTKNGKRLAHTKIPALTDMPLIFSPDASLATYYTEELGGQHQPVIDTRSGRMLWKASADSWPALTGDKFVIRRGNAFDVYTARTGKFLLHLPAARKAAPLSCESREWLYSINDKNQLFRQRFN